MRFRWRQRKAKAQEIPPRSPLQWDTNGIKKALGLLRNSPQPPLIFWNLDRAGHFYKDGNISCYIDFTKDKGWRLFGSNEGKTKWYDDGTPPAEYQQKIKDYLTPVARYIRMKLPKQVVLKHNPKTLLERFGKVRPTAHINCAIRDGSELLCSVEIDIYEPLEPGGRIVCLVSVD